MNEKGVMVYGEPIELVLSSLSKQGINLFPFAYSTSEEDFGNIDPEKQPVAVVCSSRLIGADIGFLREGFRNSVSHIVVSVTGNVLEQNIYDLLGFRIPLIISSKGYDEIMINDAVHHAGVPVIVLSDDIHNDSKIGISVHNIKDNGFCLMCMKYLDQVNGGVHTGVDVVEMLAA